jgi:rhodanese-related sulfurtransferase
MQRIPREPDEFFKVFAYEQIARVGKAISAPARLVIMNVLNQGPRTVEALAEEAGLSVANTSRHLQILRGACLVRSERHGNHIEYAIADAQVSTFFLQMKDLASTCLTDLRLALREIADAPTRAEAVERDALIAKVSSGESVVIDVRPAPEYRTAHVPGARSVPVTELERHLADLPKDREIVAYCRGRYCVLADRAVEILRKAGFKARRSDVDVADWKAGGMPVEAGRHRDATATSGVQR